MNNETIINGIVSDMKDELHKETEAHGPFPTTFHGKAVIEEELDELWEKIKSKTSTGNDLYEEAIQIGAMAMRFCYDLLGDECE